METAEAPAAFEGGRELGGIGIGPEVARRRRAALHLGDGAEARLREGVAEAAHQATTSFSCEKATSCSSRSAAAPESSAFCGDLVSLGEVLSVAAGRDRAARVEEDGLALRALRAGEDLADRRSVLLRGAAGELAWLAARNAEVERVDLALSHLPVGDLVDEVRSDRRELVDAARSVDDERATGAELGEHLGDRGHELRRVDADHLCPRACRVRERAEHVEHRAGRELAPHRGGVAHRGVVGGGEEEAEPELVDRALDPLGRLLEVEAERLEDVGRARRRRHRAVAVLRHAGSRGRRHERRRRRDVEGAGAVAARPRRVDEVVALRA